MPSGTTSLPMPPPGITAMLNVRIDKTAYPVQAESKDDKVLTSDADSKVFTKSIIFSTLAFGHSAYSAQPWNFTAASRKVMRSEEHTSELQSRLHLVCRLLLE